MDLLSVLLACTVSFVISIFSVSIGGTSLITVPVLISLGLTSKNAVATNMFALIFLSASGAQGFRKVGRVAHPGVISLFSVLTVCGSLIGANLVLAINEDILRKVIAVFICTMVFTLVFKRDLGIVEKKERIPKGAFIGGSFLILVLGIYGGFFSGGYVTLLSYVLLLIFGLNFLQVAFLTKILNVFSSLVACVFFYYHGFIDFSLGIPMAFSMSLGALLGARIAIRKGNQWIRNLFVIAALFLALKLLFI
ncbi:MAG: sulfite exporter TauE/SafE family protein [Candidatus Aminicenantes bacterium]|nr:sulfite exporter TauE/SafE family protein [Candidatus Aminicenantes bacterium]